MAHLVLKNVTLVDGTGVVPQAGVTILVNDNKIEAIGPDGSVSYPEDSAVYDVGGRVVLPGLIDAHIHIAYPGILDLGSLIQKNLPAFLVIQATQQAKKLLHAGVTSVRDGGSKEYIDIALRQAIDKGMIEGPRIRACGYGLKMTGGHGDSFASPRYHIEEPGLVNSPDEARLVARTNIKMGADHIKFLSSSGGILSATPGAEPGSAQFTVEEMAAAVDVAHKAGKKVMAHLHGTQAIKNALQAGVDSVEHGSMLDDEAIEMMVKQGAYLVPTFLAGKRFVEHGASGGLPEDLLRRSAEVDEHHRQSFQRALEAGVLIAMGTDCGTPFNYHGKNLEELPLMVEAGMTPMQAIVASTRTGAELLGLSDLVGTIELGKRADIVVVDGNPIEDITLLANTSCIVHVMKDGAVVRSSLPLAS